MIMNYIIISMVLLSLFLLLLLPKLLSHTYDLLVLACFKIIK